MILGLTVDPIGTQALQVIEEHADLYEAYVLTANNRVELLIEQARRFMPEAVVTFANEDKRGVARCVGRLAHQGVCRSGSALSDCAGKAGGCGADGYGRI